MEEKRLEKWEEFEDVIPKIFQRRKDRKKKTELFVSPPLFRGHEDSSWNLKTTLERLVPNQATIRQYYDIMRGVHPTVQSLTEKTWDLPWNYSKEKERNPSPPPGYEFMVYLRHLGFPSPLLDWSRSPYVAAFFAFRSGQEREEENIAIYSYLEYYGAAKTWKDSQAAITGLGPYITTHKRHFNQQCEYTICKKRAGEDYVYCNHEEAFYKDDKGQDVLTKFILPRSERSKVLERLYTMNINSYSLFGNEESLMETLAYQEIERKLV